MEQKSRIKVWHRVVAFLVGYVAAGLAYEVLPIALAYPAGALRGMTGSDVFSLDVLTGIATVAAIVVCILVYRSCIRNWCRAKTE
jgi:hypothetical protein